MRGDLAEKILFWLLGAEILFVCYAAIYLGLHGCLPPPFFYVSSDTFMDYFHTNYWAGMDSRYEQWGAIYPIAVFAFAQLVRSPDCEAVSGGFALRACDLHSVWYLLAAYVLGVVVAGYKTAKPEGQSGGRLSPRGKLAVTLVMLLSVPGLYALERGNYIVLALLFLALSAPLGKSWRSALFLALAINVKQYLLVLVVIPIMKRNYRYALMTLVFAILVNTIGMLLVHDPHYSFLLSNMLDFSAGTSSDAYYFEKMWNSTALVSWYRTIQGSLTAADFLTFGQIYLIRDLLAAVIFLLRLLTVGVMTLLWLRRNELSQSFMAMVLITCMMANSDALGGYAPILCFPFLLSVLERERCLQYLGLLLIMFLPLEFPVGPAHRTVAPSFLGVLDGTVDYLRITLGAMVRPLITAALVGWVFFDLLAHKAEEPAGPTDKESSLCF
jgi:hypothetical protein